MMVFFWTTLGIILIWQKFSGACESDFKTKERDQWYEVGQELTTFSDRIPFEGPIVQIQTLRFTKNLLGQVKYVLLLKLLTVLLISNFYLRWTCYRQRELIVYKKLKCNPVPHPLPLSIRVPKAAQKNRNM